MSWPKKSSGVSSEITEDVVREPALPLGLVARKRRNAFEARARPRRVWPVAFAQGSDSSGRGLALEGAGAVEVLDDVAFVRLQPVELYRWDRT